MCSLTVLAFGALLRITKQLNVPTLEGLVFAKPHQSTKSPNTCFCIYASFAYTTCLHMSVCASVLDICMYTYEPAVGLQSEYLSPRP